MLRKEPLIVVVMKRTPPSVEMFICKGLGMQVKFKDKLFFGHMGAVQKYVKNIIMEYYHLVKLLANVSAHSRLTATLEFICAQHRLPF